MLDEVIHAARAGDSKALDELGRWLNRELRLFFSKYFEDSQIDDLVQQTCADILSKLAEFDGDAFGFRKWVTKAASFEALTLTRERYRQRARERSLLAVPITPKLSPASTIFDRQWREAFDRCLAQLPEQQREAVQNWLDGGSDAELAEREGISVRTVYSRRHRGRQRLMALLEAALATPGKRSPSSASPSPGN